MKDHAVAWGRFLLHRHLVFIGYYFKNLNTVMNLIIGYTCCIYFGQWLTVTHDGLLLLVLIF